MKRALAAEFGIIPARAGFTPGSTSVSSRLTDHPRSRGVYVNLTRLEVFCKGSSPLARGLHQDQYPRAVAARIIPARAGFTVKFVWGLSTLSDHPRSRGVYRSWSACSGTASGSSPLARGLQELERVFWDRKRIIPARAGFTRPRAPATPRPGDHPRSRGVYGTTSTATRSVRGSSPLARGLRELDTARGLLQGIIPARAGFTSPRFRSRDRASDHPRSRGVYKRSLTDNLGFQGSSPLARGLLIVLSTLVADVRIIPARAGFTTASRPTSTRRWDHPRSRGVYSSSSPPS